MASSNMSSLNPNNIGETRRISTCSGYSTGPGQLTNSSPLINKQIPATLLFAEAIICVSELVSRQGSNSPRRISAASSASGYYSDDKERTSFDAGVHGSYKSQHWRYSFRRCKETTPLPNSAIFISLIGFILHLQMKKKKETPRRTKKMQGHETGGALTLACDKQILKSNTKI